MLADKEMFDGVVWLRQQLDESRKANDGLAMALYEKDEEIARLKKTMAGMHSSGWYEKKLSEVIADRDLYCHQVFQANEDCKLLNKMVKDLEGQIQEYVKTFGSLKRDITFKSNKREADVVLAALQHYRDYTSQKDQQALAGDLYDKVYGLLYGSSCTEEERHEKAL